MPELQLWNEFAETIASYSPKLAELNDVEAGIPTAAGKWTRKQILGHLIDSAANNHQRFVRAAAVQLLQMPGYDQNFWVDTQNYAGRKWESLVVFWVSYNEHLLHTVRSIPESAFSNRIEVGDNPVVTLAELAADYLKHMQHHLRQIVG